MAKNFAPKAPRARRLTPRKVSAPKLYPATKVKTLDASDFEAFERPRFDVVVSVDGGKARRRLDRPGRRKP